MDANGEGLKHFRTNSLDPTVDGSNSLTQGQLCGVYSELNGVYLAPATYCYHENGQREPGRVEIKNYIAVFLLCGGMQALAEANRLLRSFSYADLEINEVRDIHAKVQGFITEYGLDIVRQFVIPQPNSSPSRITLLDVPIGQVLRAINASQSVVIRSLFPNGKTTILEQLVSSFENKSDNTVIYYLTRNRWEHVPVSYSPYHLWKELLALFRVNQSRLNELIDRAVAAVRENDDYFYIQTLLEDLKVKKKICYRTLK